MVPKAVWHSPNRVDETLKRDRADLVLPYPAGVASYRCIKLSAFGSPFFDP